MDLGASIAPAQPERKHLPVRAISLGDFEVRLTGCYLGNRAGQPDHEPRLVAVGRKTKRR